MRMAIETTIHYPNNPEAPSPSPSESESQTQQENFEEAFKNRKIRVRLHGCKLPHGYTIALWLPGLQLRCLHHAQKSQPRPSGAENNTSSTEDIEYETTNVTVPPKSNSVDHIKTHTTEPHIIGSVYQRRWFITLNAENNGFTNVRTRVGNNTKKVWHCPNKPEPPDPRYRLDFPFVVRGPKVETSVLTRRPGAQILKDHGVVGHQGRGGWKPIE